MELSQQEALRLNSDIAQFQLDVHRRLTSTSAALPIGQDLAAFLLGLPGGTVQHDSSYADQDVWYGFYLQDDWRATPKLTLNLGLRIEHETPVIERYTVTNLLQ